MAMTMTFVIADLQRWLCAATYRFGYGWSLVYLMDKWPRVGLVSSFMGVSLGFLFDDVDFLSGSVCVFWFPSDD